MKHGFLYLKWIKIFLVNLNQNYLGFKRGKKSILGKKNLETLTIASNHKLLDYPIQCVLMYTESYKSFKIEP